MELPEDAWDCHVHCFDSRKHPFRPDRAYTPQTAPSTELWRHSATSKVVVVQASIENGYDGLLDVLSQRCQQRTIRGVIATDPSPRRNIRNIEYKTYDRMHALGVRGIRIHGAYGGDGDDLGWAIDQLRQAANLYPVQRYQWHISAQLPLRTWAAITDALINDHAFDNITFVADHNGSATPSDADTPQFDNFLRLLASRKAYVKVGALFRRSADNVEHMQTVVQRLAASAPTRILWGSDWPHVDPRGGHLELPHLKNVDTSTELRLLRAWLADAQWENMLIHNPKLLYE